MLEGESFDFRVAREPMADLKGNSFLFHKPFFLSANKQELLTFLHADAVGSQVAKICFHVEGEQAKSQTKSPFGSFDLVSGVTKQSLSLFTAKILEFLKTSGVKKVVIVSFPQCYDLEHFNLIEKVLLERGFTVAQGEVTQYIRIRHEDFVKQIHSSERRYINWAKNRPLTFKRVDITYLQTIYTLISKCRLEKGYPVTMTYRQLYSMVERFPERYLLFGLFDRERMIAGSVTIKVNDTILYNFYHGDDLGYRNHSPIVALIHGIYNYARDNRCGLLDLGVSTESGKINPGLYNFKKALGAVDSKKITFEKTL